MDEERKVYPSDVTDAEWSVLEKVLPRAKATGRPRKHALREMANASIWCAAGVRGAI